MNLYLDIWCCILAYRALDAQLDRLNSVLDAIEERNDRIHGQLKDMLKTSQDNRNNVPNDHDSDQSGGSSSSSSAANWW